jgi:glutamate formiminotransferase/formiminotetrahydrofolate cyclodeaminase
MEVIGGRAQALKDAFLEAVDRDTEAFNAVIASRSLPRGTDEERERRDRAVEEANQLAARVPLEVLERAVETMDLALAAAREGNPASVSDAGTAGACALAAAEGAALNVRINLPGIGDARAAAELSRRQEEALERARRLAAEVRDAVDAVLNQERARQ